MWNFKIFRSWEEIWGDKFQKRWMALLNVSPTSHVFFHPVVAKVWVDTYMPLRKMDALFLLGDNEKGNEFFLPLVLWHKDWKNAFMKTIVPVGYSDYDYHAPLFKFSVKDSELDIFWHELLDVLTDTEADEICIDGIYDSVKGLSGGWIQNEICPCLNISEMKSELDLLSFFGTKLRGDIRRQIRRLNEIGPLNFTEYASGKDIPATTFNAFMDAHRKKWPNAYKAPGFHENLINKCCIDGPIHFSTLNIGDTVIAWHLGFDFNGTYYYYMPAGNPEFSKLSPVKIHLYYLICRAIKRDYKKYDHLRGDETYKSGWADGSLYVNSIYVCKNNGLTKIKKSVLRLKNIIKI